MAEIFTDVGRQLVAGHDREDALHTLCEVATQRVPGAQHAGVTVGRNGQISTVAATGDVPRRTDAIQFKLGSGPCVDALVDDARFNAADLRTDPRWPEFGRRAAETTGVLSMLAFRLFFETDDGMIAGLNMYSQEPRAFGEVSETIGVLLATHGALALASASARDHARSLEIALQSSRGIGAAVGILMSMHKLTQQQAFDLLLVASQSTNRKVRDIAREVVDTGILPTTKRSR
jgi:ANTAR domain-containing protein/GAF domain-containing protein